MRLPAPTVAALLLVACSRPPGPADETTRSPGVSVRHEQGVVSAGSAAEIEAEEELARRYRGMWPTGGGAPGAGEPRVRVPAAGAPARGAEAPLVTIVVFSDIECPFCARLNPTLEQLLREHPDDVRVVFRHFPLPMHRHAEEAAEATLEAWAQRGETGFWRMHDLLFDAQDALGRADLEGYAARLGLDVTRFARALDEGLHEAAVERDVRLGRSVGVTGTPTLFVNGRSVVGSRPFGELEAMVREEIALAAVAMENGVPREHLYAAVLAAGSSEPPPRREDRAPARPAAPERREPPEDAVYRVPVDGSPALGPRTALVTLVEFADVECPFCQQVQPTLDALRERYGDELRIVWKHNPLPFHRRAMPAAMALMEARAQQGDRGFWRMHARLMDSGTDLETEDLAEHARALGLNMRRFRRALDEETHRAAVEADMELARRLGATGTPTFFVNGVKLRGAQPLEAFVELVEARLANARARLEEGTPRHRLYQSVIADGIDDIEAWREAQQEPVEIAVPEGAPWRGARGGAVTIQVFSDFECPFCSRVRPTLERLLEEYPSQVRLVWRNYPLPMHPHAALAAEAAMEVHAQGGNDAFWAYHDLLFDHQDALAREDLERYADQLGGMDMVRFRRALDERRHRNAVAADVEAVRESGERIGTPAFLIGGRFVQGAQPFEVFRDAVERALGDHSTPDAE